SAPGRAFAGACCGAGAVCCGVRGACCGARGACCGVREAFCARALSANRHNAAKAIVRQRIFFIFQSPFLLCGFFFGDFGIKTMRESPQGNPCYRVEVLTRSTLLSAADYNSCSNGDAPYAPNVGAAGPSPIW